jgi:hypothetical protein
VIDQCLENLRVAKACPTISSSGAPRAERLVKRANKAHDTTLASQTGAQFDLHGWHSSIGPRGGAFVGSDQIAEIAPGVKEALVGGPLGARRSRFFAIQIGGFNLPPIQ